MRNVFIANHIKAIVSNGGNAAITDINGDSPLHIALSENLGADVVAAFLDGQPKPSPLLAMRNKIGWTPMRILASHHELMNIETLKVLKDFGGDINETDISGNSLLHVMFSTAMTSFSIPPTRSSSSDETSNFGDIAKIFVDLCAAVNVRNNLNHVPLRLAIDLPTSLDFVIALIPSVNILNDDSCWDGLFIDYLFENLKGRFGRQNRKFMQAVFVIMDDMNVSAKTLFLSMGCILNQNKSSFFERKDVQSIVKLSRKPSTTLARI